MSKFITKTAGALSAAALLLAGASANAATFVSTLDHSQAQSNGPWGTVTITEVDANNVRVQLDLAAGYKMVDTGAHQAFSFNLVDSPNSTVTVVTPTGGTNPLTYQGEGTFANSPFGNFTNAFACCGPGANNAKITPFIFNVYNASGITFAGVGYTTDSAGRLTSVGTGNRFASNTTGSLDGFTGGWWFATDVVAPDGKTTGVVAARDAFVAGVPEPATWAMMIIGFGAAGSVLRRRRTASATA